MAHISSLNERAMASNFAGTPGAFPGIAMSVRGCDFSHT